jgi:hypothetical protein
MMTSRAKYVPVVLATITVVALISTLGIAQTTPDDSQWISPKTLTEGGVHLPSYITSVDQHLEYQASLPIHQELSLEWRSLPSSSSQPIKKQEAER